MYLKSKTSYIILLVAFLCILPLSLASANDRDEKICSLKIEGVGPFQSIDEAEAIWRTTEFAFESKAESKLKGRLLKHLRFIKTPPDPRGAIRIFWNNTISSSNSGRGIGVNVRTSRPINPQSWRSSDYSDVIQARINMFCQKTTDVNLCKVGDRVVRIKAKSSIQENGKRCTYTLWANRHRGGSFSESITYSFN